MDTRECEMRDEVPDDLDPNATPMWPQDRNEVGSQFNVGGPLNGEEVAITVEPAEIDQQRLTELTDHSEKGASQFAYLVKHWEYRQANAVRLLKEELDSLSKQKQEVEQKTLEVLEEHRFEQVHFGDNADKRHISIDDLYDKHQVIHEKKCDAPVQSNRVEINADYDTVSYWKQKAVHLEKLLQASMQREQVLMQKLEESIQNMEKQSTPLEELSQMLERADNFIHFILQNAPIVLGHMDKELRYRFIYNHYPSFKEENYGGAFINFTDLFQDLIGKTETEIFSGVGVKESLDFKREVLERGLPGKREITFDTELFGSKTFLIYVEPVFNKAGETIGVNYIGMDITDQVRKREKMAKLREEIAVQKAMETELNRMLHINDETMRAKEMLATMSHEIRSPLSGVISIAELLATTNLNPYQNHLISLMISSGEVVIQLINDILDLSRVESGVMKLEAIKFRPREVVKHVIQTAAASSKKTLMMEGHITKEVPLEVVGDVMRIRQILTNLLSNAIKFTHEGKVGIKLQIVPEPSHGDLHQNSTESPSCFDEKVIRGENRCSSAPAEGQTDCIEPISPTKEEDLMDRDEEKHIQQHPSSMVWIRCDVYDTGIGIPEKALPTLFKQYTQVSADHARKYGGTGLGLSICKQLVELMGGSLHVTSKEQFGSTFTFVLPYRVSPICNDQSDDLDEFSNRDIAVEQPTEVHFQLQPQTLASFFAIDGVHSSASPSTTVVFQPASSCLPKSSSLEDTVNPPSKLQEGDCKMETSDRSPPSMLTTSREVTQSPKKPRILLVEDNKINVMVTKNMMSKLGHAIEVVNNGAEAVRAVQSQSYDLIFMDVCMPVMDGLEATRIIREYENTGSWDAAVGAGIDPPMPSPHSAFNSQDCYASDRRIPIIAMTANALAESEEECIENGMDSIVTKPVTFLKLKGCLDEFLPGSTNPIP